MPIPSPSLYPSPTLFPSPNVGQQQNGLGDLFYLGGNDLSGDVGEIKEISGGPALVDVTNLTQSATARIGTTFTGLIDFTAFFNATGEHPVLKTLPTTSVIGTYVRGTSPTAPAAGLQARQPDYKPTRGTDGSLTFDVALQSDGAPLEWGHGYVGGPFRTDTAATTGASVDDGAATSTGFTAYLHVLAFTGTTAVVVFEHSADNGVTDPWSALLIFNATTTAPSAQRIATTPTLTVKRYVRTRTSGVFTNLVFYAMGLRLSIGATGGAVAVDVQTFPSSGTWIKPAGATATFVLMLAGGGGGGSGACVTVNQAGPAGGGGGGFSRQLFATATLAATETVVVGAGGTGGAPKTSGGGNTGGAGGTSSFGTVIKIEAVGGFGGSGGTAASNSGGTGGNAEEPGGAGGGGNAAAAGSNGTSTSTFAAPGGGAGGGMATTVTAFAGGIGGSVVQANLGGGSAGGPGVAGGSGISATASAVLPGSAGGGGGATLSGNGAAGGNAGSYGAGGGGGGGANTGFSSGAGGNGAPGIVVVVSW